MNLKEKINKLRNKELERIKNELTPYFKNHGELRVEGHMIKIKYHDKSSDGNVVEFNPASNTFRNKFYYVYEKTNLNIDDIFEEIDNYLEEIKVKPIRPTNEFDAEEWKQEFAERNSLDIDKIGIIYFNDEILITKSNNVNTPWWHLQFFKHPHFKFDGMEPVYLTSEEECDDFERIFIIMRDYLKEIEKYYKESNDRIKKGE